MKRRDSMGIAGVIADANKILWQRGLTLVRTGPYHLINNTNLLDHTDELNPANAKLAAMLDATNSMGNAVELYFVNTLDGTAVGGVCRSEGIAIAAVGDGHTIAHEVMHDCGLEDIYTVEDAQGADPHHGSVGLAVGVWSPPKTSGNGHAAVKGIGVEPELIGLKRGIGIIGATLC